MAPTFRLPRNPIRSPLVIREVIRESGAGAGVIPSPATPALQTHTRTRLPSSSSERQSSEERGRDKAGGAVVVGSERSERYVVEDVVFYEECGDASTSSPSFSSPPGGREGTRLHVGRIVEFLRFECACIYFAIIFFTNVHHCLAYLILKSMLSGTIFFILFFFNWC